jgi:hypothetical protein
MNQRVRVRHGVWCRVARALITRRVVPLRVRGSEKTLDWPPGCFRCRCGAAERVEEGCDPLTC